MAKKLNTVQVNMTFSANTAQAKAQVQDLQSQLNSLTRNTHLNLGVEEEIRGAIAATAELSAHLQKATNIDTGNLDFAKLNQSLKASGKTLQEYGLQLQKLGPQGQQAFLTLAQSIASAEIPLKRTNLLVKEFWTTLQNTARWQLSSSVLHGFMGAVQSAYGYAQDLNESLNNIRIVTNRNTDEMAKFAKEANKAAKALSATTTEYTNASLIYYQQGLSDKQVKERADVTVKLANVSRQSAEEVSDQMTSIWNNFYNGSKSLEYYADVMTALGAATASSTEEIAGGLEKFAAVADTIGLSYEYAAAALATITSNTRQSEEVVGTALKTIFARIQGLNLGETLEDGTTLNKYSEALDKVGVNIYDANMQLKDMDTILNELGGKWNSLGKDQQVALAQTVAGVRQYNQLIALMDNWNKGDNDSFIANLNTANAAAGSLQQQADIYAESWEAAADRVTAAAESLYDKLINDEFFIDLLNNVEKVLSFIDQIIDGLGGLQGVLLALGTVVTKVFATQISQGLTTLSYNLQMSTEKGRQKIYEERRKFIKDAQDAIPASNEYTTNVEKAQKKQLESSLILQSEYLDKVERMSELEKIHTKQLMDRAQILRDQNVSYEKQIENIGMLIDKNKHFIMGDIALNNENAGIDSREAWRSGPGAEIEKIKEYAKLQSTINLDAHSMTTAFSQDINAGQKILEQYKQTVKEVYETVKIKNPSEELRQAFEKLNNANTVEEAEQAIEELNVELEKLIQHSNAEIKKVVSPEAEKNVDELTESLRKKAEVEALNAKTTREAAKAQEDASKAIKNAKGAQKTWSDIFVASTNAALSLASALQMITSGWETLTNPELTTWQKFTTLLTTTAMLLGTIVNLIQSLKTVFNLETVAKLANAAATWAQVAADNAHADASSKEAQATGENTKKTNKNTLSKVVNTWNDNALGKSKEFELLDNGKYHKIGDPNNTFYSKEAAGQIAGKSALKGLLTKAGGVALIAAGVIIAAATIKGISDYIHKAEKELEKTKKVAAELNNLYSEMTSKHNEFTQSLSNYKSAQDGLKGLVKGTQEYQDAVVKANNEAMALLETNKNLKYEIVDGVITIDEGSLMSAQQQIQQDLANAQAAKFAGQQNVMLAEENIARRDYARSVDSGEGPDGKILGGAAAGGAAAGAAIAGGAALLAASGPIGWAIAAAGLVIGGAIGIAVGAAVDDTVGQATEAENDAIDKIAKAYQQDSSILNKSNEEIAKTIGIEDQELINSLMENKEELTSLIQEINVNTAAINAQNDLIAAQLYGNDSRVINSRHQDSIIDVQGDVYGNNYEEYRQYLENTGWGEQTNKKEQSLIFDEYLGLTGLDKEGYTFNSVETKDGERYYKYTTSEGEEKKISLDAMRIAVATTRATQKTDQNVDNLIANLNHWEKTNKALYAFLGKKSFNNAIGLEFNNLQQQIGEEIDKDTLKQIFGVEDLSSFAQQYGYDTADDFLIAFKYGLSQEKVSRDDIQTSLGFDDETMKYLSTTTGQNFAKQVQGMYQDILIDASGNNKYIDTIDQLLKDSNLNDQDKTIALEKISEIDWTEYDAAYKVADIIKELGGEVDITSESFKNWASMMNIAGNAMMNYEQLIEDLTKLNSLINEINLGDIISQEDYELILKYNKGLEEYFNLLEGGKKAELIGDPLQFIRSIQTTGRDELDKAINQIKQNDQILINRQEFDKKVESTGYSREELKNSAGETVTITGETHRVAGSVDWDALMSNLGDAAMATMLATQPSKAPRSWYTAGYTYKDPDTIEFHKDQNLYDAQLKFLNQFEDISDEQIQNYQNNFNQDNANHVASLVSNKLAGSKEVSDSELRQHEFAKLKAEIALTKWETDNAGYFSEASYQERKKLYEDETISLVAYAEASERAITAEKWDNIDVQSVKDYADSLMELGEASSNTADTMQQAADAVALFGIKTQQGLNELKNNFEEWNYLLQNSQRHSYAYNQSLMGIKEALSDLLGVDEDFITEDFIFNNLNLINDVINNNGSIESLQSQLAFSISEGFGKGADTGFKKLEQYLNDKNLDVGVNLKLESDTDLQSLVTELSTTYGLSPEQIQAYLNAQGYDVNFAKETYKKATGVENALGLNGEWVTNSKFGDLLTQVGINKVVYVEEEGYKFNDNGAPIIESITKVTDDSTVSPPTLEEALDKLTEAMQLKLEIDNRDLEILDYKLSKIKDDFYGMAEGISYLLGTFGVIDGDLITLDGSKLDVYNDSYKTLYDTYNDIIEMSGISKEKITEKLNEVFTATMNNLQGLQELDNTMMNYYSETLALASKELENYTKQMAHHTDVLEHYKNLLSLTGKENDYKALDTVLKGQVQVTKNQAAVSKATYEMHKGEVDYWAQEMEKAQKNGNTEGYELYRKNWLAAQEAARESQNQMLSDLEAWAEAEKEILKNTLADLGRELEKALTGGMSFDELSTSMERTASLQEEYLTTTNQIYETTKLMRTAQQAIDTSTNIIAKNKLKAFITETKSMQEQTKLSQYELDIQQAKYNLLVAEIALEEAQNAKNTVRLQRDAEGNFGYVYTADTTAVNEAQQQFDDAQNALYNIGLNGANNYAQNYTTTLQEMYDTLQQINENRMNGLYATEEEYNNAMAAAKEYYYAKLQNYSNLYSIALTTDSKIVSEAWSRDFDEMIVSTETWETSVESYLTQASGAFTAWASAISQIEKDSGLNNLSQAVGKVTTESNNLKNTLLGTEDQDGVIDTLDKELNKVNTLVTSYGLYRTAIQGLITDYENLIDILNKNMDGKVYIGIDPSVSTGGGSGGGGASLARGATGWRPNALTHVALNDDGGYTGSWGPEGKWAILHEEEMILTKDETKQFFNNLSIMENILSTLDSYALNQQMGGLLMSPYYSGMDSGTLEQNVHIEASFPGVTDRNEIEEAFNNLVNKASQYANRK